MPMHPVISREVVHSFSTWYVNPDNLNLRKLQVSFIEKS